MQTNNTINSGTIKNFTGDFQEKFRKWREEMKEFQDQQVEDMHMEKCMLESDRKQKFNLS